MHKIYLRQALMHVWVQQSAEAFKFQQYIYFNSFRFFCDTLVQGVPKKRKLLKSLIVKIECPTKKLNVMMRKILTRCMS